MAGRFPWSGEPKNAHEDGLPRTHYCFDWILFRSMLCRMAGDSLLDAALTINVGFPNANYENIDNNESQSKNANNEAVSTYGRPSPSTPEVNDILQRRGETRPGNTHSTRTRGPRAARNRAKMNIRHACEDLTLEPSSLKFTKERRSAAAWSTRALKLCALRHSSSSPWKVASN
jgi:hypothetical protein